MAISRKPKAEEPEKKQDEKKVNAVIHKGGSVAKNAKADDKPILVRIPADALEKIDNIVNAKLIKTPRHTWLLEAIYEKLERES